MTDDEYYEDAMRKVKSLDDVVTIGIGHNSEAKIISGINSDLNDLMEIKRVYEEESRTSVEKSEGGREEVFMSLGLKLLEGRKAHESDILFGDWCNDNFPNLSLHINKHEQASIVWAAEFPEQRQEMLDKYPRVNTTRGSHKKWKEEQEELNAPPDDPEDDTEVDTSGDITGDGAGSTGGNTGAGDDENDLDTKVKRGIVVPAYRVDDAMGAIKGISELFNKRFEGTKEEAASVLMSELIKGCETDDIGLSIAKDYVKWFLSMKEVMDLAEPELRGFLNDQPKLKIVK